MKKIIALFSAFIILGGCSMVSNEPKTDSENIPEIEQPKEEPKIIPEDIVVDFIAVGDNLIHGAIYYDSEVRHQGYEFDELYDAVKPYVEAADIAYINQETILGGTELGLSHYPMFNSPQEIGTALVNAGFDWIASSSNHSMDKFEEGIISSENFWEQYPEIVTTGLNRTEEERHEDKFIERNGVKFGVLGYTYGTNGIPLPEGKEYLVNIYSEERIREDVEALKGKCDAILVSMHWGIEYSTVPSEEQEYFAQLLADLGVAVVIGEHPHVIQPMEWVEGKDGNQTLVIYSLGNFMSAQDGDLNMLGGMASWSIRKNGETGAITVENVKFYPTVTHFEPVFTKFKTYLLKDYTDELAAQHGLNGYNGQSITRQLFIDFTNEIMNDQFEIIY